MTFAFPTRQTSCALQDALASPRAVPREPCRPTTLEAAVFAPVATGLIVGVAQPTAAAAAPEVVLATEAADPAEGMVAAIIEPSEAAVIVVQADPAVGEGGALPTHCPVPTSLVLAWFRGCERSSAC